MRDRPNAWHPPSDWNGVDWSWYIVPCPDSQDYKASLRGALLLLTEVQNWDETLADPIPPVKAFSEAYTCMADITFYFDQMVQNQTDMIAELAGIKDALIAADGEGGFVDIATILFEILPVLLATSTAAGELESGLNGLYNFFSGDAPAQNDALIRELIDGIQFAPATSGGGCCDPNPTSNGLVNQPDNSPCQGIGSGETEDVGFMTLTRNSATQLRTELTNTMGSTIQSFSGFPPDRQISIKGGIAGSQTDDTDCKIEYGLTAAGAWNEVYDENIAAPIDIDVLVESNSNGEVFLRLTLSGASGDIIDWTASLCPQLDTSKPMAIIDLGNGVGQIQEGGIMSVAGQFVLSQFNPTTIKAEIAQSVARVELDWTRPFSGTVTIETLNNGVLVETVPLDPSNTRRGFVEFVDDEWDELLVIVDTVVDQVINDLVTWAVFD